jgi:hypothetical protein
MKRALKIAGIGVGSLALLGGVFAATWPSWVEGYAERKMDQVLSSKFDEVKHGEFELTKTQVIVKDLVLSNPDASLTINELTVDFTPMWFDQKVIISSVSLESGSSVGTLEGFKSLRSSDDSPKKSSGRVDLSNTSVNVKDFGFDLTARGYTAQGSITASASSLKGPFELSVDPMSVIRDENVLFSAAFVETTVDRENLWPLELTVGGVSSSVLDVMIEDVEGTITVRDQAFNIFEVDLRGRTDEGQTWSFDGLVDRPNDTGVGHLVADGLLPSQLPIADLPISPEHGTLSVDLELRKEKNELTVQGQASVMELHVVHRRLARDRVVLGGDFELIAKADLSTRELVVETLSVQPRIGDRLSTIKVEARGRVLYVTDASKREYELELHMDATPCQEVLEAMPLGLFPALEGFELGGETRLDMKVVVKMADPLATVLEGGLESKKCKLKKVPDTVAGLEDSFMHLVRMKNGHVAQRPLMHGHAFYVPYNEMPGYVAAAVLATEDGGFWKHKGYRLSAFRESLRRNVELGTFRRGASTLSMQMVKNVLLTHEKTVSRKLQEIFLTWAVEKVLPKTRIMEIYLNVVEYGPGIFGVAHAADHYFGKSVDELTSLEAVFLATLLPRPLERHDMWCRGKLTPKHDKYIRKVHARMLRKSGHLTQEEYDQSELEGIVFSRTAFTSESECLADGAKMRAGKHTQGALSGLLGERQ